MLNLKTSKLKKKVRKELAKYIGAGFGLVASLAWNEAIKEFINAIFPLQKDSLLAKFIYAFVITVVVVVLAVYVFKDSEKKKVFKK